MLSPDSHHSWYVVVRPMLKGILLQCRGDLFIIAEPNCRDVTIVEAEYIPILFFALQ